MPIPRFDPNNGLHAKPAKLSGKAGQISAKTYESERAAGSRPDNWTVSGKIQKALAEKDRLPPAEIGQQGVVAPLPAPGGVAAAFGVSYDGEVHMRIIPSVLACVGSRFRRNMLAYAARRAIGGGAAARGNLTQRREGAKGAKDF